MKLQSAQAEMRSFIGRHHHKTFDWRAFTVNDGYPQLARAQMRYVGAGGSPKSDDPDTLKAEHFTVSLVSQPVGKYASSHMHEVDESFLVLGGVLSIVWLWGDEAIEARLGRKDLCLNMRNRVHGFKNEGLEPVLASISVGSGQPLPPAFSVHPRDGDPELAARFGAAPGKTCDFDPESDDPRHRELARHLVHYSQQPVIRMPGFSKKVYVGDGGAPAGTYRMDLVHLAPGEGIRFYERDVEDTYLVIDGVVTVGWEVGGHVVEQRLGMHDLIFNPAGRPHYFRNDGCENAQFMMTVGDAAPERVEFLAA
ncbi:MAG: cupin domain-containing protein [Paraburkholderia sp.]|jgi:quercetin dioxygenase-like cupin family protein|nr:cupin domain-containing protein [Paraburkholderia sp.]